MILSLSACPASISDLFQFPRHFIFILIFEIFMTAQHYSAFEPLMPGHFKRHSVLLHSVRCTTHCVPPFAAHLSGVWHCGCAVPFRGATMYTMCHAPQGKVTDMPLQDVVAHPDKLSYPLTFCGCATALTAYQTLFNIIVPSIS